MKSLIKNLLHKCGLSKIFHTYRNATVLTVAMFHRVLPPEDARFRGANPLYTITPNELEQCVKLFRRLYSVVSIDDVVNARDGAARLPRCPLLITFDDGWQDNRQYAAPILARYGLPSLLFVATGHIGSETGFWQEEVYDAVLHGRTDLEACHESASALLAELDALDADHRKDRLDAISMTPGLPRRMADRTELAEVRESGMALGGHGHSHEPLTAVDSPEAELAASARIVSELDPGAPFRTMSFPHGRYDTGLLSTARECGFDLVFTSDSYLNPLTQGLPARLGRIEINLCPFRRADGNLDEAALAFSMVSQPHQPAADT